MTVAGQWIQTTEVQLQSSPLSLSRPRGELDGGCLVENVSWELTTSRHTGEPGIVPPRASARRPEAFPSREHTTGGRSSQGQLGREWVTWWHLAAARGTAWREGEVSRTKQFFRGEELEEQGKETAEAVFVAELLPRTSRSASQGRWNYGHDHGPTNIGWRGNGY